MPAFRPAVLPAARGNPEPDVSPASAAVTAYGVRIGLRAHDQALLERLRASLPPGCADLDPADTAEEGMDFLYSVTRRLSADGAGGGPVYVGRSGSTWFVETQDEDSVVEAFESAVRFDVAVTARAWVFVHAGVVAWQGAAIVIPAPSMHGKSRLVEALVRAGATYYSDEFAVIDRDGLVHPFRIPMSLRRDAGPARRVRVEAGPAAATPIRLIVSTAYEPGAEWRPQRGTPGEALLALFSNTVRARIAPAETLQVLASAVQGADLVTSPRDEADAAAAALLAEWR